MPVVLVVDDDPLVKLRFQRDFADTDIEIMAAATAREGLELLADRPADVVVLDIMLPDASGLESYEQFRQVDAHVPVLFITADAESETAIEAMKLGAYDYLTKPLDRKRVRALISRAIEIRRMAKTPVQLAAAPPAGALKHDTLVGRSPSLQAVYKAIGRVAPQNITVLITGESGTGKELVARAIYQHSRRAGGPFLAINCAAIPESLLESELFGHEQGAFTGADRLRIGKFEQCAGGTLFLDEIGDMTPSTQSKVLRVLQDRTFERVGGNELIHTDVRVIAASHRNLERMAKEGRYRADLFYRLNDFRIHLPPLRERVEDIPMLLDYFLARFTAELDKDVRTYAPEVLEILTRYPWPGNVREFQSALKQALLNAMGEVLIADFLPDAVRRAPAAATHANGELGAWDEFVEQRLGTGSTKLYSECVERLERLLLARVLRHTGGNQARAARILGITRGTLRNKIRDLRIRWSEKGDPHDE